jgi:hypothetical protein
MVDDNEIRQVVRSRSEQFLDEARKATRKDGQVYDLEKEFAKTRKNRSFRVVLVTLATLAGLVLASLVVTGIIRHQTAAMPVDVKPFEDLNLGDLLDTAKKSDADLEQAKLDLSRLQAAEKTALQAIDHDLAASLEAITARHYPKADEKKRKAQATAQAEAQKKAVRARYESQIADAKERVASIQATIDSFDKRFSEQTRKQQEVLDSQARLFDLEKQNLIATYTGKIDDLETALASEQQSAKRQRDSLAASYTERWNPVFDDPATASLLTGFTLKDDPRVPTVASLPPVIFEAGVLGTKDAAGLDSSYGNLLLLSGKLRDISYVNSVPPALDRIEYEARLQYGTFRGALERSGTAIVDQRNRAEAAEAALERFRWAAATYIQNGHQDGCLVDCRNTDQISVIVGASAKVSDGSLVDVKRPDAKEATARLSLYVKDGVIYARLVSLAAGDSLRPFDPFVLVPAAAPAAPTAGH